MDPFLLKKILFLGTSEEYSWQLRNSLAISRPLTRESLYSAQECMFVFAINIFSQYALLNFCPLVFSSHLPVEF